MIRAHLQMAVHQSAIVVISIASILAPARWLGTAHDRTDTDTDLAPSLWPGLSKGRIFAGCAEGVQPDIQGREQARRSVHPAQVRRIGQAVLADCNTCSPECVMQAALGCEPGMVCFSRCIACSTDSACLTSSFFSVLGCASMWHVGLGLSSSISWLHYLAERLMDSLHHAPKKRLTRLPA